MLLDFANSNGRSHGGRISTFSFTLQDENNTLLHARNEVD